MIGRKPCEGVGSPIPRLTLFFYANFILYISIANLGLEVVTLVSVFRIYAWY